MPRQQGVDYVVSQLMLSARAIRSEIEHLQLLERQCVDPKERTRISNDWNRLEVSLDGLIDYALKAMADLRSVQDAWALRALKVEPSARELSDRRRLRSTKTAACVSALAAAGTGA